MCVLKHVQKNISVDDKSHVYMGLKMGKAKPRKFSTENNMDLGSVLQN